MITTIYIFQGQKTDGQFEKVKIFFNDSTNEIYAKNTSGGVAEVYYLNYEPVSADGDLLYTRTIGDDQYNIYWQLYYPFGYLEIVSVTPPPPPPVDFVIDSINVTPETEVALNDGTATINVSGGVSPYEYSLDGVNYFGANVFISLAPGDYSIFVRDSSADIITGNFIILPAINPPDPPQDEPVRDIIALSDAEIEIQNAYKRVKVLSKFGQAPSVITNGDFEVYDGQNWEYWTKYGNINVSRVQRTVKDSLGNQVPIQNYALRFNERANETRYIQHSDIPVQKGDSIKVSYRVSKTEGTGDSLGYVRVPVGGLTVLAVYSNFFISKIRIKCGDFYLYNEGYGNSYVWLRQVTSVNHRIDNSSGDLSNFIVNFNIPECPVTGAIVFQFFGFQRMQVITPTSPFQSFVTTTELTDYPPIEIDDISASKSSQNGDNDIEGILSISDNLRFFSQIPETKEILFGDYFYRADYLQPLDNLYAIKYNRNYTTGWYEYTGGQSVKVPFSMSLAKSILTAYQKPFRKWSGDLRLTDLATRGFSYLDVYTFNIPNSPAFGRKQFTILGGDFNLKTRQLENAVLVEIFDRAARSNDVTVPSYPNMPDPVFVQDPNANSNNGIFSDEFTNEFN